MVQICIGILKIMTDYRKNSKMSHISENNNRIAKNTLFLYLRMFVSLAISIITGRVVLQTLGVEDYGINAVVGSVVGMFGVINTSMVGATSRFITYEMGRGDEGRLKDTFSTTVTIHFLIGIILIVLLETVGLWFVNTQLVIPENRMFAANCIYQFSIISILPGITQIPYSACLVAHEKLDVYAYFDILNTILKLVIIYLLLIGDFDKLILYGFLSFCVGMIMLTLNRVYCIKKFPETHYHFVWDKTILKPMLSFSGWDTFGSVAGMARGEGVAMLINMFFGPAVNAASGIANSVTYFTGGFANNIIMAARPQLIKRYAQGEHESMIKLMHESVVLSFLLMTYLTIPLMSEIHFVLNLWLGIVPDYACIFTNLVLAFSIIGCIAGVVIIIVHATGRVKRTSIVNGTMYLLVIPITYVAFKTGAPAWIPFAYNAFAFFCGAMFNVWFASTYVPALSLRQFFCHTILPCIALFTVVAIPSIALHFYLPEGWLRILLSIGITVLLTTFIGYQFMLDKEMRAKAVLMIKNKVLHRK